MNRYTVKAVKGTEIQNLLSTNDYSSAMVVERTAKQLGYDEVWICDNVMELMVG
jgi:hypothetical protein